MNAMDLERQRWQEHQERKRQAQEALERQQHLSVLEAMKASVSKQTVLSQDILEQVMSDAGYEGYRVTLFDICEEWHLEQYTQGWGWNRVGSLGFKQGQGKEGCYKTVSGALRRIKKELERR